MSFFLDGALDYAVPLTSTLLYSSGQSQVLCRMYTSKLFPCHPSPLLCHVLLGTSVLIRRVLFALHLLDSAFCWLDLGQQLYPAEHNIRKNVHGVKSLIGIKKGANIEKKMFKRLIRI